MHFFDSIAQSTDHIDSIKDPAKWNVIASKHSHCQFLILPLSQNTHAKIMVLPVTPIREISFYFVWLNNKKKNK